MSCVLHMLRCWQPCAALGPASYGQQQATMQRSH